MKIKHTEFRPVTITIETQDELDQLAAMAYHCNFDNTVEGEDISRAIYRDISDRIVTNYRAIDTAPVYLEIVK